MFDASSSMQHWNNAVSTDKPYIKGNAARPQSSGVQDGQTNTSLHFHRNLHYRHPTLVTIQRTHAGKAKVQSWRLGSSVVWTVDQVRSQARCHTVSLPPHHNTDPATLFKESRPVGNSYRDLSGCFLAASLNVISQSNRKWSLKSLSCPRKSFSSLVRKCT